MLQKILKIFMIMTGCMAVLPLCGQTKTKPDGRYYYLDFEDMTVSPRARVVGLTEKLKRMAKTCLPTRKLASSPPECVYRLSKDYTRKPAMNIRFDRLGFYRMTLPDNYWVLNAIPDGISQLAGWILAVRFGIRPEEEQHFRNSWFVTGLVRRAVCEITLTRVPFPNYYPAAYALTSRDYYPTLYSLLSCPLSREDAMPRLLYEEYCDLFLVICQRNGLFRGGMLVRILEDMKKDFRHSNMAELFRKHAFPLLCVREKKLFHAKMTVPEQRQALEQWFRKEVESSLNWNFLPASIGKVEIEYKHAIQFEAPVMDKNNPEDAARKPVLPRPEKRKSELRKKMERTGEQKTTSEGKNPPMTKSVVDRKEQKPREMIRGSFPELIANHEKIDVPAACMSIIIRLRMISRHAPAPLTVAMGDVERALHEFSEKRSEESGKRILEADRQMYLALEKMLVLEQWLAETELTCVSTAAQHYLTMPVLYRYRTFAAGYLRDISALLDGVNVQK